ncbi:MAG TPA: inositol monophosphatase family protein [Gemmatimonadota bacterium]|nr:inositol monophosphatase family protein [Gemmatimonadota bacterium]
MSDALDGARALAVAREAAQEAVASLKDAVARTGRGQADEKAPGDFVTEADREAERRILARILAEYPEHSILAEESGGHDRAGRWRWAVDPLDGTANYVHGFPAYAVSIALFDRDDLALGLVVDVVRGEWFTARAGAGARVDTGNGRGEALRVSSIDPSEGLLATGFPFRRPEEIDRYLGAFRALFERVSDMRRAGSAALDLAWTAAGRVEGFWEIGLNLWDIAAGELLVREAGGRVSDWRGGGGHRVTGWIAAGGPAAHDLLLEVLGEWAP